jgi:hypothetical protein
MGKLDPFSIAVGAVVGALVVKWYVEKHPAELVQKAIEQKAKDALTPKGGT